MRACSGLRVKRLPASGIELGCRPVSYARNACRLLEHCITSEIRNLVQFSPHFCISWKVAWHTLAALIWLKGAHTLPWLAASGLVMYHDSAH